MHGCAGLVFFILFIWGSHLGPGTMLALAVCIHAFWGRARPFLFRQGMCVFLSGPCADGVMAMAMYHVYIDYTSWLPE